MYPSLPPLTPPCGGGNRGEQRGRAYFISRSPNATPAAVLVFCTLSFAFPYFCLSGLHPWDQTRAAPVVHKAYLLSIHPVHSGPSPLEFQLAPAATSFLRLLYLSRPSSLHFQLPQEHDVPVLLLTIFTVA